VLVERQTSAGALEQLRQPRFALPEGKRPKILAIVLQQIECVQDGLIKPAAAVQSTSVHA
jgi:hypothetical protein